MLNSVAAATVDDDAVEEVVENDVSMSPSSKTQRTKRPNANAVASFLPSVLVLYVVQPRTYALVSFFSFLWCASAV